MLMINEKTSAALASHAMAYEAVRAALIDAVHPATALFPVVHGHGSDANNRFTVKSGATPDLTGLKVGSYWPGNAADGLPCHNSIIFLFDQSRGVIHAAVEASTLNAYRTAAADAVATDVLAGKISGREAASDITVFDSSGLAIQDLYIAKSVINAHHHQDGGFA